MAFLRLHRRGGVALAGAVAALAAVAGPAATARAAVLDAPHGLAPDSAVQQKDVVLSWQPVPGASSYVVQLSHGDSWTNLVPLPDNGTTSSARLVLPMGVAHGAYTWRVRAVSASGHSDWSTAELVRGWNDAPQPAASPGFDATVAPTSPAAAPWRFSWAALPDASSYEIQFSNEPTFPQSESGKVDGTVSCLTTHTTYTPYSSVQGQDANVDDCKLDFQNLTANTAGVAYWRVRGIDDSSSSVVNAPTLACFGLSGDPDVSGASTATALGTPTSSAQECSKWSATQTVPAPVVGDGSSSVDALTPPRTTLSCTACPDMPEITWTPVPGALKYRVTISDDQDRTSIERVYDTPFLSLTPRDQLPDYTAGSGYWVDVQACVAAGCGPSAQSSFTKSTPSVSGLTSTPIGGAVVLAWNDLLTRYPNASTPGAPAVTPEQYRVEVTAPSDDEFSSPVVSAVVDAACAPVDGTCYTPSATGAGTDEFVLSGVRDGSYLWRVVPMDLSGNDLRPATSTVVVDTTPPAFRLTDASGFPVDGHLHVRVSEPVTIAGGDLGSALHVVSATTGSTVAGTFARTSATSWTFTPSGRLVTGDSYTLKVVGTITDGSNNAATVTGTAKRATTAADDRSPAWVFHGTWAKKSASDAVARTYRVAGTGASAKLRFVGASVRVVGCRGPHLGKVSISVDGSTRTVTEHQSFTECGVTLWKGTVSAGTVHNLTLTVVSTGGALDAVKVG